MKFIEVCLIQILILMLVCMLYKWVATFETKAQKDNVQILFNLLSILAFILIVSRYFI